MSSSLLVDAGGRLSVGGVVDAMRETEEVDCLCPLLFAPPNREGRREKRPVLDLSMACTSPQPLVEPYYGRLGGASGTFRGRVSPYKPAVGMITPDEQAAAGCVDEIVCLRR